MASRAYKNPRYAAWGLESYVSTLRAVLIVIAPSHTVILLRRVPSDLRRFSCDVGIRCPQQASGGA